MKRREFITLVGCAAAAWPLVARGQQPAIPVIGVLGSATATEWAPEVAAFHKGLSAAGFDEGRNISIQYRWAEGQYNRLPAMAADLVQRNISVIAALTTPAALAAKAATATIPIVFTSISDPVQVGLVASLSHPGGNATGATFLNVQLGPKLLELLHEIVPTAARIGLLANPTNPNFETASKNLRAAADTLGLELHVLKASTDREIGTAFAKLVQLRAGGLVIGTDVFLDTRNQEIVALARSYSMPTIHQQRSFVAAGGLMSYSGSRTQAYREAGIYTARVLGGEKPADLPVQQAVKVELVINLQTAKTLGLTIPLPLLGRADEVIE